MIKIIKLRLRNLDNKHLNKAGGHIGRNVLEITIKMKTIVPKTLNDKNHQDSSQKFRQQRLEEGPGTYRPKRCGNNNKDEDICQKTLNDKNQQASSQKFRQQSPE